MALPVITSIAPITGPAAGGTIVTLTGTGFTGALAVGFGSTDASALSVMSDTTMVAVSPPGTGSVNVTVVTPDGRSAVNAAVQFGYSGAPSSGSTGYYLDPALSTQIVATLLNLIQTNNSPDAVAAQSILMRRMALEGDVVGSRIPPPKNISEIGGYINLLGTLGETAMSEQMLAGVLGVAGPSPALGFLSAQPLSMVSLANDRPAGAAQASLPLSVLVRSDFSAAFLGAPRAWAISAGRSGPPRISPPRRPGPCPPPGPGRRSRPAAASAADLACHGSRADPSSPVQSSSATSSKVRLTARRVASRPRKRRLSPSDLGDGRLDRDVRDPRGPPRPPRLASRSTSPALKRLARPPRWLCRG